MIEKLMNLDKVSILQCREIAKKHGFDSMTFDLVGPKGKLKAKWLDAYFGMFKVEGAEGFLMVKDFQFNNDLYCENITPVKKG